MVSAILVAFKYQGTKEELPSIVVDLYLMYNYCKSRGMNVIILSDIYEDKTDDSIHSLLDNKMILPDILTFIKDNNDIIVHISETDFKNYFEMTLKNSDNDLFVYFTGHAERKLNKSFFITNTISRSTISFDYIRDAIYKYTSSKSKIVIVMDCCHSYGLKLPYNIDGTSNNLTPRRRMISIAQKERKSRLTTSGSFFTIALIKLLSKNTIMLTDINNGINNELKNTMCCNIGVSYLGCDRLFSWMFSKRIIVSSKYITMTPQFSL